MAMLAASSSGSAPRAIVPEIGQVSTRSPCTRTYISGDAPTRYSPAPSPPAEVEQELERGRVPLAAAARRTRPATRTARGTRGSARPRTGRRSEPLLRPLDDRGVPAGHGKFELAVAAVPCFASGGYPRLPLQAGRPGAADRELVGVPDRLLAAQVDDVDLVRQVQHQVPLAVRPVLPERDRLELERQVVAERPVQPQVRVVAAERGDDLPQRAEHRRLPRPLLLGERPVALGNVDRQLVGARLLRASCCYLADLVPTRRMASAITGSRTRPRSLSARAVTCRPRW